jgi:hypothetical protein
MQCPKGHNFPNHAQLCPACGCHVGFPNVRTALRSEEITALKLRWESAHEDARNRGAETVLNDFEFEVQNRSRAVICRGWGTVDSIVSNDNVLLGTFYLEIAAGIRNPENNAFDEARHVVDSAVFPLYEKEIRFAALTLNGRGPEAYGRCSIVLKDEVIDERTTVFEENTLVFCRQRGIQIGTPIPPGFRAQWKDRYMLAGAKLHKHITASTDSASFPSILLTNSTKTDGGDFIEVHIYGSMNRHSIEQVRGPRPAADEDRVIVDSIERKLNEVGASLILY